MNEGISLDATPQTGIISLLFTMSYNYYIHIFI